MPRRNIYEAGTADALALFEDYFDGDSSRVGLTISGIPLDTAARNAVEKSLQSFGYGERACTFAALRPIHGQAEDADVQLDPQALFLVVEALDPLLLIVADERAARMVAQAYRTSFDLDANARVFGRPTVVFQDFAALMNDAESKQKAWALLKGLPRRSHA